MLDANDLRVQVARLQVNYPRHWGIVGGLQCVVIPERPDISTIDLDVVDTG